MSENEKQIDLEEAIEETVELTPVGKLFAEAADQTLTRATIIGTTPNGDLYVGSTCEVREALSDVAAMINGIARNEL